MNTLNHIRNFLRIDDRLATSGLPLPDDFTVLRQAEQFPCDLKKLTHFNFTPTNLWPN